MSGMIGQVYRRPRCRIVINGAAVFGCQAMEVSCSNLAQATSFFVHIALTDSSAVASSTWLNASSLAVSLQMGLIEPGAQEGAINWQEMVSGTVDRIRYDPVTGSVTIEGRDRAASLIDLPLTEAFLNTTSSDVAGEMAQRCGLSCVSDPTTTMVGQYYQIEHSRQGLPRFSRFGNAWDLLCSLAQLEGFDLWVQGQTLYFVQSNHPPTNIASITFNAPSGARGGTPSLDVSTLTVERTIPLESFPPVQVSSWNSRQRLRVTATAGVGSGSAATIQVVRPNLLQDTAEMLAAGIYGQASVHKRVLSTTMPGELSLMPRDRLILSGVGSAWDGNYRISTIDREMTLGGGFTQSVVAKLESD